VRSKFTIAAITVLVITGTSAWAQKAAVIDMQGAILQTKDGQKASADLKVKFGPKEQEINQRGKDLIAKQADFQKNAATLSDAARAGAQRDLTTIQKALQRDTDDARADVQAEENRVLGTIMQKMQAVMQRYAADKQISMIVDLSSQPNNLLYADKSVNITADIILAYDAASVGLSNPAPAPTKPAPPAPTGQPAPQTPAKKPAAPGPARP
jgi:outer membrane protein